MLHLNGISYELEVDAHDGWQRVKTAFVESMITDPAFDVTINVDGVPQTLTVIPAHVWAYAFIATYKDLAPL